ncbi:hypothetical protein AOC36_00940 [Erysipelothrix larvae]|uniref:Transposase n=1 Tax=Erysipelothrix larvae TaxID=1514105 RepID=A0A109UGF7_9FIRM|nr:IS66 family insertion sequence element accessory protein TnpB [Erysipelothrix larvae]AMC92608.1 hypothetical protein AOC36_00940 [Erysipelothrix larvae]
MIDVTKVKNVYIAQGYTDLRKGIDGYSTFVSGTMKLDPFSSSLFLFCNRSRDKLKVLFWDGNGFWLFYKRLESGKFKWPKPNDTSSLRVNHFLCGIACE